MSNHDANEKIQELSALATGIDAIGADQFSNPRYLDSVVKFVRVAKGWTEQDVGYAAHKAVKINDAETVEMIRQTAEDVELLSLALAGLTMHRTAEKKGKFLTTPCKINPPLKGGGGVYTH